MVRPMRNFVLRSLGRDVLLALDADLKDIPLASGDVLYEPNYPVEWVYFPQTAVLSVVTVMADGRTIESDTIGCESMVGALAALGGAVTTTRTFTQIPGLTTRMAAGRLRHHAEANKTFYKLLVRHTLANLAQVHQSVACNALHDVSQRLSRWLLMSQDRTASDAIELTHEYLATMVGVHRTTVTEALRNLAEANLIRNDRRRIEIIDRTGMEALVCECYDVVRGNLERLTGEAS
jgi:CRP-like cAMP-binding protein